MRRQVAERVALIIVESPGFDEVLGFRHRGELVTFKHPSRSRPLNDSMKAFSTGLPGQMKLSCMPRRYAQTSSARDWNSVP
jgi:hypothetical protein